MILIDTSIWIEFLKGNAKYFNDMAEYLAAGDVYSIEVIFSELLQGARNDSEVNIILDYWDNINHRSEEHLWIEAGKISYKNNLFNKGVGIVDAMIIAFAKKYNLKVWTLDKKLLSILDKKYIFKVS